MLDILLITNLLSLAAAYVYFRRNADAGVLIRYYLTTAQVERILAHAAENAIDAEKKYISDNAFYERYWNNGGAGVNTFEPSRVWLSASKSTFGAMNREFQSVRRTLSRNHITAPTGRGEHPQMYLPQKQEQFSG